MKRFITPLSTLVTILVILVLISSCNLPFNTTSIDAGLAVTQTLSALATQVAATQAALANPPAQLPTAAPAEQTPITPPLNTAAPVIHTIIPGEMQAIESTIDDVLYNSDNYAANLYERPYTEVQMVYRADLDLQKITLSSDNTFFYFALNVKDINSDTKTLVGNYGVELDVDRDGRGDYLLWVSQTPGSAWDTAGVTLFTDQNNDVGGPHPLLSDAPFKGDGYETEVWPGKPMTDADGAWARIDPASATTIQIAVKRSLVGSPASFLWNAWSDDQIKAPYLFDYNDSFTAVEAGSPVKSSAHYPLAKLALMDNTCRGAWGFTPTGNEPGICKKTVIQPTKKPLPQMTLTPTPLMTFTSTNKPTVVITTEVPCVVQIGAQVTDGSTWDPSWASGVTLCLNGSCQNPDSSGYVIWYMPPGIYTITASAPSYGITPASTDVKLGCGEKTLSQFVIGPG